MRQKARRDNNEPVIRHYLEALGFAVATISSKGIPDLLVWHETWGLWLIETKAKKGRLTPSQVAFFEKFEGAPIIVGRDIDQILAAMGVTK